MAAAGVAPKGMPNGWLEMLSLGCPPSAYVAGREQEMVENGEVWLILKPMWHVGRTASQEHSPYIKGPLSALVALGLGDERKKQAPANQEPGPDPGLRSGGGGIHWGGLGVSIMDERQGFTELWEGVREGRMVSQQWGPEAFAASKVAHDRSKTRR
ncbi:hypothetical protein Micbo1qcDRAFT_172214 [Microdochium bolleyi]|uniref:Uncharacterized protein n=1 Tax=Microdochium bolleyi TaxID=196109 RepID=A0A136JFI0_9PEZI|nr:hypothetical protein Micbo1qcDRAFT_172214 [Microdochium bolleyi]